MIQKLSFEYEIPFVIVMTQCYDDSVGELENTIRSKLPEIVTARILAKDYPRRNGKVISAYGIDRLLKLSIMDYNTPESVKLSKQQSAAPVPKRYSPRHCFC